MTEETAQYGAPPPVKPKKIRHRPTNDEHAAIVRELTSQRDEAKRVAIEAQAGRIGAMAREAEALRLFSKRYFAVVFLFGLMVGGLIDRIVIAAGGVSP